MMKNKFLSIIAAAAAVLVAAACNRAKESDPNGNFQELAIQPDVLALEAEGVEGTITFDAPDYWFANCPDKWITVDPYSGKPGKNTLTFKAKKNTVATARSAVITVNAKSHKGKITVTQEAWPYSVNDWTVFGTIGGNNWDVDLAMEDLGDKLVWKAEHLPYYIGEVFKFHMTGSDSVVGLNGNLVPANDLKDTYVGTLSHGGDNISLPDYGFWDITLDLVNLTVTATLDDKFPWSIVGTVVGGDWDTDYGMTDKGGRMVWEVSEIPYHAGEAFKFRMNGSNVVNLGLDGELIPANDLENTYKGILKQDGGIITLPEEGYWTLTLDVNKQTLTGVHVRDFARFHEGIFWENADPVGNGAVAWSSQYRFGLDGRDGNHECITTFPEEIWSRIKTETFYVVLEGANPNIRVTTGWWSTQWGADIQPGNELLKDNGDGTWTLTVNLSEDAALQDVLDQQHLLLTGDGYTPLGIYPEATWVNSNPAGNGAVAWSSQYRFGLEEHDGNHECIATFPETVWNKLKSETFYLDLEASDPQIRVTTGWWSTQWGGDIQPGNELLKDNGDGTWTLKINISEDAALQDVLDQQHLLFTGDRYTPLRIRIPW